MTQKERRLYLIRELLREQPEYSNTQIPANEQEQRNLLRSLFNIRMPQLVSEAFLEVQDAYLQERAKEKGITDSSDLTPAQDGLYLWKGDITTLRCDAIVNAANSQMLGCFCPCHGCIDNAIHTFSGVQLRSACAELMRQQGQADAMKYKAEKEAEAQLIRRQREAEAQKYEALQQAEARKAEAEALRFSMEQEAEGIRAKGLAEAEAIEKKAEAQKRMGEASILEMYLAALPEVVKNAAAPLSQTEKIVMYGDGNSTKLVRDIIASANQVADGMRESTGIDLQALIAGFAGGKAAQEAEIG